MLKKKYIWDILCAVFLLLQLVAEVWTAVAVVRLNMLPDKYLAIILVALAMFLMLSGILMFLRFGKPVGMVRRVIACLLALVVVAGCAVGIKVVSDAYETMHKVTQPQPPTDVNNMYIMVRVDDPAQSLEDIGDYSIATLDGYEKNYKDGIAALIEEATGSPVKLLQYTTSQMLADKLLQKDADAIAITGAGFALLLEEEDYTDLEQKVRILHSIPLYQLETTETTAPPETTLPPEPADPITTDPFILYISGSDTRSTKLNVSRSDVNILAVVNPATKQILLMNTPRDYYVPNPTGNGQLDKLTNCGLYGTSCSMKALGDMYGLQIDYYAQINFTGFETLIDAVGGVTVYSDMDFKAHSYQFYEGANYLDGKSALMFARERYTTPGGDRGRGKNQMKVITALIEKMTSGTTVISNYSEILNSLEGMFKTNVSMEQISELVKMQLDDMASWNIQTYAVSGVGGSEHTYSAPGVYQYVMYMDDAMIARGSRLAQMVIEGKILTADDVK